MHSREAMLKNTPSASGEKYEVQRGPREGGAD